MTSNSIRSHKREVLEIQIPVPFGHVAGKWWGRRDIRPILCIHGWQDNAASFDTLIPMLPDHIGYLAIDLPGHGFSSRIPDGLLYSTSSDLYIIHFIIKQFGWTKVSLMGHSMGGSTSYMYAATFPDKVDLVIELDALHPRTLTPETILTLISGIDKARKNDIMNMSGTEPPTYTKDEMIDKMNNEMISLTRPSALSLLTRAAKESITEKGRFYFTRDLRLKSLCTLLLTDEINVSFAQRIDCPLLYVKARHSPFHRPIDREDLIVREMKKKTHFEMTIVEGEHHVHLNEPQRISEIVSKFLLKHRNDEIKVVECKL